MDIFEYLSVAISIVLAMGLATLLRALRDVLAPARRYWVHALWVLQVAFLHVQLWWAYWDYSSGVVWTFPKFILLLFPPATLYLIATALVGAENDASWREYFYRVRRWFFSLILLYMLSAVCISWLVRGVPLTHPYRILQGLLIIVSIVGLNSRSHPVHVALISITIALYFFSQIMFRFFPNPLGSQ